MKTPKRIIPSTMASQHPDHADKPYWYNNHFIDVHAESEECFRMFSELGIDEYKWDWEGKLVDESVMERLLGEHFDFFKDNPLGERKFITFRLPNPKVETEFRLGRAFLGILSAAAMAKKVGFAHAPLFEVILPMTETSEEMLDIQTAFQEISGLKHKLYKLDNHTLEHIELIPLFEQVQTIINSDKILEEYIDGYKKMFKSKPEYLRPYIARSDPALNSGLVPTVLAVKIALSKYKTLAKKLDIPLYPIIGTAALPFRGGLTPENIDAFVKEYKGIRTVLIQGGFRYDYPKNIVIKGIKKLDDILSKQIAMDVSGLDEIEIQHIIPYFETYYRQTVEEIAPIINQIASFLPKRRERVQHIGLFGYSRGLGKVSLPRAIGFTGALYSIGIPPELVGTGRGLRIINSLGKQSLIDKYYLNFKTDILKAGRYLNRKNLADLTQSSPIWGEIIDDIDALEKYLDIRLDPVTKDDKEHQKLTSEIYKNFVSGGSLQKLIEKAGILRHSLG